MHWSVRVGKVAGRAQELVQGGKCEFEGQFDDGVQYKD